MSMALRLVGVMLLGVGLTWSGLSFAQSPLYEEITEPDGCIGYAFVTAKSSVILKARPFVKAKGIAKIQPKQYLCIQKTLGRNWFYMLAVPDSEGKAWCSSHGLENCPAMHLNVRWLINKPQGLVCTVSNKDANFFTGVCAKGWIHRKYLGFVAG